MMYGLGIPLLFPVAALGLFVAYVCERISLAYVARQPPAMDDTSTRSALATVKYAPLFLLANGWWMLSNRQIFGNAWSYVEHDQQPMPSRHWVVPTGLDWATPVLLTALAGFVVSLLQAFFGPLLASLGFAMARGDIEVDEDLPNFWEAVKLAHADEAIKEAVNMKDNYMVEVQDPQVVAALVESKSEVPKRATQRTPWYNILSN